MQSENVLIWNVRGLNDAAHRDAVRHLVTAERISLVCLQETKLADANDFFASQLLGAGFDHAELQAAETRDDILVAWKSSVWSFSNISAHTYSLSGRLKCLADDMEMWLTVVYGPSR